MSVKKQSAQSLHKRGKLYFTLDSTTFELIRNDTAAAIWAYLMSKSNGWQIRSADLQKRFGNGRDKTRKALKLLKELKLIQDVFIKDPESGKITDRQMHVWSEPYDVFTVSRVTLQTENPTDGFSGALPNKQIIPKDQVIPKDQTVLDKFSVEDYRFSRWVYKRVHEKFPLTPIPKFDKWADEIRLLREHGGIVIDGKAIGLNHNDIAKVFDWANNNNFWSANIRSTSSLRNQFETLTAKMIMPDRNASRDQVRRMLMDIHDTSWA